ncbi:MAG: serine/threonine-protein phosphatase, partial [Ilumatobacter sp.]|nr:serine/threonine-protein phosphatase [Ilumatobacter sp.]
MTAGAELANADPLGRAVAARPCGPPAPPAGLAVGVGSVAGPGRAAAEDATICGPVWFAIADGMGGSRDGGEASATAMEHLRRCDPPATPSAVAGVIAEVDRAVRRRARQAGAVGMGSTLTGLVPVGHELVLFHIGDSRCYQLVDGRLDLLTRDHSHVQDLVDAGRVTADAARSHRLRHVITRALGSSFETESVPDVALVTPSHGRFLLCSDGVTVALGPRSLGRVLAGIGPPTAAAERLVQLAVRAGARDDVTALVVDRA